MSEEEKTALSEGSSSKSTGSRANGAGRSRLRILIPLIILLILVGLAVWYFFLRGPAVPTNLIVLSGRIETDNAAVGAKTSGRIREITVREGDRVTAGQVIAILDDDQVRAREEQARAVVTGAQTRITRAQ